MNPPSFVKDGGLYCFGKLSRFSKKIFACFVTGKTP